jgi:hypothetical protein
MQYVTCEHIVTNKVIVYKSCGEVSLLVQFTTCTFWPAQSCSFKKCKVYETIQHIYNITFAPLKNLNKMTHKKVTKIKIKFMSSKMPNSPHLTFCFMKSVHHRTLLERLWSLHVQCTKCCNRL